MTLYTIHKDGALYRGEVGAGWRSRKKSYVFVTKAAARTEVTRRTNDGETGLQVARYVFDGVEE